MDMSLLLAMGISFLLTLVKVVNRQGIAEGREGRSYPIGGREDKS